MILQDLLDIDPMRIERSKDMKVTLDWSKILTTPRRGFFSKLWGFLTGNPFIISNLLRFVVNSPSGSKYTVYVELQPKDTVKKLLKTEVKIFCSCNDFKYRSAYTLGKENNLFLAPSIEKHLGIAITEPPRRVTTTNLCKHLYAVMMYIKSNLNKLNLTY